MHYVDNNPDRSHRNPSILISWHETNAAITYDISNISKHFCPQVSFAQYSNVVIFGVPQMVSFFCVVFLLSFSHVGVNSSSTFFSYY